MRQFYENLTARLEAFLRTNRGREATTRFREGVSPLTAMQFATRFLVKYFEVEVLFGVQNHFGRSSRDVLSEMTDILKYGLLKPVS